MGGLICELKLSFLYGLVALKESAGQPMINRITAEHTEGMQ